ncbi:MAG: HEAT repeat domain-containing protein [Kofleriaceae bacterium]
MSTHLIRTSLAALTSLALGAALVVGAAPAAAGVGGSANKVRSAVASGSVDAILAEVERVERKICNDCIEPITALLEHARYEVREVAAWWFAKRPGLKDAMIEQMVDDLAGGSLMVRNAADFLGTVKALPSIPVLTDLAVRADLSAEARQHVVRALGKMGHASANPAIEAAFADADATVRAEAVDAWHAILYQQGAAAMVDLLDDADALVRAKAAAVIGSLREASARVALEAVLASDVDPSARRNAAWALGRLGQAASRPALEAAMSDASSLVRNTARVALAAL